MKILITGATGFIGSRVVEKLKNKYGKNAVVALSSAKIDGTGNGCEDVETILHIGAFTPKSGVEANNIEYSTSNVHNTEKLLSAAGQINGLKKVVFISTLDVYAESGEVLTELTQTIPQTMYGWSKLYCEQMIKTFCGKKDIKYCILRLGHVYGEGEEKYRKVIPVMIEHAISGEDIKIYGDGNVLRTFIYVDDVAQAIVNSIGSKGCGIINVVGEKAIRINDLAKMIIELSGSNVKIVSVPCELPCKDYVFDNSKLMNTLLVSLIPLEEGLMREVEYMRNGK